MAATTHWRSVATSETQPRHRYLDHEQRPGQSAPDHTATLLPKWQGPRHRRRRGPCHSATGWRYDRSAGLTRSLVPRGPGTGGGVVGLGGGNFSNVVIEPAGDDHLAFGQQGGGVGKATGVHGAGLNERIGLSRLNRHQAKRERGGIGRQDANGRSR